MCRLRLVGEDGAVTRWVISFGAEDYQIVLSRNPVFVKCDRVLLHLLMAQSLDAVQQVITAAESPLGLCAALADMASRLCEWMKLRGFGVTLVPPQCGGYWGCSLLDDSISQIFADGGTNLAFVRDVCAVRGVVLAELDAKFSRASIHLGERLGGDGPVVMTMRGSMGYPDEGVLCRVGGLPAPLRRFKSADVSAGCAEGMRRLEVCRAYWREMTELHGSGCVVAPRPNYMQAVRYVVAAAGAEVCLEFDPLSARAKPLAHFSSGDWELRAKWESFGWEEERSVVSNLGEALGPLSRLERASVMKRAVLDRCVICREGLPECVCGECGARFHTLCVLRVRDVAWEVGCPEKQCSGRIQLGW